VAESKYIYGLGRRKSSTARARLVSGKGQIIINDQPIEEYFDQSKKLIDCVNEPLLLLKLHEKYKIHIVVRGGGNSGQADACRLAISNALSDTDDVNRSSLKKAGYLKRDPREKERKKYGLKSARKKEQYSKR
jgi:small subunit ribosomal protein S9